MFLGLLARSAKGAATAAPPLRLVLLLPLLLLLLAPSAPTVGAFAAQCCHRTATDTRKMTANTYGPIVHEATGNPSQLRRAPLQRRTIKVKVAGDKPSSGTKKSSSA